MQISKHGRLNGDVGLEARPRMVDSRTKIERFDGDVDLSERRMKNEVSNFIESSVSKT